MTAEGHASARRSADQVRTGLTTESIHRDLLDNLRLCQGKFPAIATRNDWYLALAYTVRERLLHRWTSAAQSYLERASRTVCYLSAEFLLGPQLANNLLNLGIEPQVREAVAAAGRDLDELVEQEEEPGLGNGGLGRLAACYMESLATLEIPAIGYGLRYEYGMFDQHIRDGWQVEVADRWLRLGNPWEVARPDIRFDVQFGGRTESRTGADGRYRVRWLPDFVVKGTPYDTPILGFHVNSATFLRLWRAEAAQEFDFQAFNVGDYYGAVDEQIASENITKVLYPNDEPEQGRKLRLAQQYFLVSCTLQDMIRLYRQREHTLQSLSDKYAVQLNDTHPALAIPELMRLLVDEHEMDWDPAWEIVQRMFAYTNHTLLPEALEKWPLRLLGHLLPRHLEIVYEINGRFLEGVRARFPGDEARVQRVSLIEESGERYVRMAHLACLGSRAINGVAELHTRLLKNDVLRDFHALMPEKFSNKTNGVTPRRFLLLSNPRLSRLITDVIGAQWTTGIEALKGLESYADDPDFREKWCAVKRDNKADLARMILDRTGVAVDPGSLFDVQAKRIHEYKRQHLNLLHVVTLYERLRSGRGVDEPQRTVIFGGKAAPGYLMAKLIIKLANAIAEVVNRDPAVGDRLKVVFLPDFNVKNAQRVYPAADLSEQISTAGKEASGTGNMKFAMNGALTIGTMDGANIEIREEVGAENFFLFGLTTEEVEDQWRRGYQPRAIYESNPQLRQAIDLIASGYFSAGDRSLFRPLVDSLLNHDPYLVLADYQAYVECQATVAQAYRNDAHWTRMSILNVARMGKFSSDRAIREYCRDIWHVEPVRIELL